MHHLYEFSLKSLIVVLLICPPVFSQDQEPTVFKDSTINYVEISGFGSSIERTPFWMQTNQFGVVPVTGSAVTLRSGMEKYWTMGQKESRERNKWRVGIGVEAVGNISQNNKVLLPQIHATLRFKNWELYAGRKKQWVGLADSTLGTGSYAWSTNALPIPKIHLGTTHFVSVPFTKDWLSFQAMYSDGWFEKNRAVTSGLKLHQKAFYLRIGKSDSRVKLYGGFNHQVEWGGKSPYNTVDGKMPNDFRNYFNVITGKAGSKNPSIHDNTGRVGNHLGSIDLAMEIEWYETGIFLYRQNIYEDGGLFWLNNIKDGLNGIRIKRKNNYGARFQVTTLVLEYLYTKNQGGSEAVWDQPSYKRGKDDYFNNGQVRDGWSYYDRTIGTPFITPTSATRWNWPNYADFFTSNNRVSVVHVGLGGTLLQKIMWTSKFSYSSNLGTYNEPFISKPTQFSGMISLQTRLNILGGVVSKFSCASDIGQLYPNSYGFSLGLQKQFSLK